MRKKIMGGVAAIAVAGSIVVAAPAHADPITHDPEANDQIFRSSLADQGILFNFNLEKYQGLRACEDMEKYHKKPLQAIYDLMDNGGYPFDIANGIVSTAVTTYCFFDAQGYYHGRTADGSPIGNNAAPSSPSGCYPLSNKGTCYEPGERCRNSDHGASGVAGDGKSIICADNDGWRWEPA